MTYSEALYKIETGSVWINKKTERFFRYRKRGNLIMSLSIFDVDGINFKIIDKSEVKTFIKRCGYENSYFGVEVGECSKELCDNDALIYFKLKNIFKDMYWEINVDKGNNELEVGLRGYGSCNAFLQALEFAVGVLREARDRVMFQKEEKAF